MSATPFTGLTAAIGLDGVKLVYMNNVEINAERDVIEIMQFGADFKEKIPSIKDWSASCEGTLAIATDGGQKELVEAYQQGKEITLTLIPKVPTEPPATYNAAGVQEGVLLEGKAYITSLSIGGTPEEALTISAEFSGTGDLTIRTA